MTYELIPQPDSGYASVRVDGREIARIDLMLLKVLADDDLKHRHLEELGWPMKMRAAPYLETLAVAERSGKAP